MRGGGYTPGMRASKKPSISRVARGSPGPAAAVAGACLLMVLNLLPGVPKAFGHGDTETRIHLLNAEMARMPRDAELYRQRGILHALEERWEAALADYIQAAQLDPALEGLDYLRAKALFHAGRDRDALKVLDGILATGTGNPEVQLLRARVLCRRGQFGEAADSYTQALNSMANPSPDFFIERARALRSASRVDEALAGLDEAIEKLGPVVTLLLEAVDLELDARRYDEALARMDPLLQLPGRHAPWLVMKADILARAGRPSDAAAEYRRAEALLATEPAHVKRRPSTVALRERINQSLRACK